MKPQTLADWESYIDQLDGAELFSQTVAANSQDFASALISEGKTMAEVEQILLAFTKRLRTLGVKIPEGGPFDLVTMALTDTQARKAPSTPEDVLDTLPMIPVDVEDDFEVFEREAENDD